jgi:serine-type D-Ala-D-Ala carboxypeptidase/endopeptidase
MRERFAEGHDAAGAPTPAWDFDVLAGAGAVRSTASDLALLVRAAIDARTTDDDRPIMRALRTSMEPHMVIDQGRATMGLGWHIVERGGHRLIMHNGRTGGYASFVGLDPDRRVGVVLLTNSSAPVDDIALALLTANRTN